MSEISATYDKYAAQIKDASELRALDDIRVAALGKKGEVSKMMQGLGKMSIDEKKVMGPALNGLKKDIAALIETRKEALENEALDAALTSETMDMSLPVGSRAARCIPSVRSWKKWPLSFPIWVSPSRKGQTLKMTSIISPR